MARRSRHRSRSSGSRLYALIGLGLVVLAGFWFWQRDAHVPITDDAIIAQDGRSAGDERISSLPLPPPASQTRAGDSAFPATSAPAGALPSFLPAQARDTLRLIARGGPFPHRQDGSVFGNREGRLPTRARGYYREYTVDTPGLDHRGARRIITGGQPPTEYYYTGDHYDSFQRFELPAQVSR